MLAVRPKRVLEQTVQQRRYACCRPAAQRSRWTSPDRRRPATENTFLMEACGVKPTACQLRRSAAIATTPLSHFTLQRKRSFIHVLPAQP